MTNRVQFDAPQQTTEPSTEQPESFDDIYQALAGPPQLGERISATAKIERAAGDAPEEQSIRGAAGKLSFDCAPTSFLPGSSQTERSDTEGEAHYDALRKRENSGEELTTEEKADLYSHSQFPNEKEYRELAKKELLNMYRQGPDLTGAEKADLYSKRQFPDDEEGRQLAKKELMSKYSDGPKLNNTEFNELLRKRKHQANTQTDRPNYPK